jgi:hypothetical protein
MTLPPRDQAMMDAIGRVLVDELRPLECAIEKLEQRIEEIEKRGIEYKGIYQRACVYKRGEVVTADGSMFVAVTDVAPNEVPGQSNNWQLAVKSTRQPTRHSQVRGGFAITEHRS